MRLRLTFSLAVDDDAFDRIASRCPMDLTVHETRGRLFSPTDVLVPTLALTLECAIEDLGSIGVVPSLLLHRGDPERPDEAEPAPVVACPELDLLALRAEEVAGALALLHSVAVSCGPLVGIPEADNQLVAEDDADRALVAALDDAWVLPNLRGSFRESALGPFALDGELLGQVAQRPGVRVYWESGHNASAVARFRELWRTLEVAFGKQQGALVDELAAAQEARELGFDRDELYDYMVLRGRASHGGGSTAHREAALVHQLVLERVGRLHALVERVLAGDLIAMPDTITPRGFNRPLVERPVRRVR